MSTTGQGSGTRPRNAAPEDVLGVGPGEDILVVDDNPANLAAFEAALAPLGRRLVMVQSGVEALAKLLAQDFALVILDVSMPGMSGFECAEMIRQRERSRGIPIIFVTGLNMQDAGVLAGYDIGCYDFLIKPIRAEILRAKARVFLQLQERTREMQQYAEAARRFEAEARAAELLAMLGQQLRNPLQALQLAVDALPNLSASSCERLERIHSVIEQRVRSLSYLVEELLDGRAARFEEALRPTRPLRVVVCEDAADICELAADLLREDGHTVFQATYGARAIELIEAECPDVALVDVALPDIDGPTVARTIRIRLGSRAPRLVALTAPSAALRPEFDAHLLMPASRERMLSVLARVAR